MSNEENKEGLSLAVAFARELAELMGGNPSRLHKWGKDLGLPVPRARQTFYSHLERGRWKMKSKRASTAACRLGSYPLNCELRLRVVSLKTQFSGDLRAGNKRQLVVLLGYEVCSHLVHFHVYRSRGYEDHAKHGIPLCSQIPAATVAAFVNECGKKIGLPLKQVFLTQNLMDFQPVRDEDKVVFLSLTPGKVIVRKLNEEADDNEVLCSFGSDKPYYTEVDHPFIDWCKTTTAKKLTADLSDLVNRHNKATALSDRVKQDNKKSVVSCLHTAQQVLDALLKKSHDAVEARQGTSRWTVPQSSPFETRLKKHDYALERYSLREVGLLRGECEDFWELPGDRGRVSK